MPIEIEAKMRLSNRAALEHKLREAGATAGPVVLETNTFFDTGESELKSSDEGLRVRVEQADDQPDVITITHKGPRAHGKLKSRSETEMRVAEARTAAQLLEALGYLPVLTFEKRRTRWRLEACNVEVDELPHLGTYCEIEGPDDQSVLAVREKLELEDAPLIRASYIAMLMSHLRDHHLHTTTIRFDHGENNEVRPPTGA